MKLKLRSKLILCSIMSVVTITAMGVYSHAVHAEGDTATGDYVLQISPATQKIGELQPGGSYKGNFKVMNTGNKALDFTVYTTPYKVVDENYTPSFNEGTYTAISKWVTFDRTSGHLESGQEMEITYHIKVPQDVPAGGQYASIMVESESGIADGSTIGTSTRLGMIIYSHVAGETTTCAKILNSSLPGFLVNPPITGTSVVENCGNIDVEAEYTLRVFPLFSDEEIYSNEDTPDKRTILPETKRFNSISWDRTPSLGIYRAEQVIKIGDEESTISKIVIICPLWLIILIILFIAAVIFWLVARNRERKESANSKQEEKANEK